MYMPMKCRMMIFRLSLLLFLALWSCKDGSLPSPEAEKGGSGVYVSIVVSTEGGTFSRVPTPGEDGDGKQPGTEDESRVSDLNVFFFHTSDGKGLNTSDGTVEIVSAYFDGLIDKGNSFSTGSRQINDLEMDQTYNVLVIANAGNRINLSTLDDLRNYEIPNPISEGGLMVMASEGNVRVTVQESSEDNPVPVSVNVERLAARIDCLWEQEYEVKETETGEPSGGKVKILGAAPVNRYNEDTFAFKRVSGEAIDDVEYLGDETVDNEGHASNYVLDPWTVTGKSAGLYDYYYTGYEGWDVEKDFITPSGSITSVDDGRTYGFVSYVRENVNTVRQLSENKDVKTVGIELYATGIMFRAQYTPEGFDEGTTFYTYAPDNGSRKIYTAEDLKSEFPDTFEDLDEDSWGNISGCEVYTNGVCYYVYWIRHADDKNPDEISPMEYAVVRNNIYQLYVNSIKGLGNPEPDSEVTETVEIHFLVKPWDEEEVEVPAFD